MPPPVNHNAFIFNNEIDTDYLHALYEGDLRYVEDMFALTITQIRLDLPLLQQALLQGDKTRIHSLVHKIKPSFGFVGLPLVQKHCAVVEQACQQAGEQPFTTAETNTFLAALHKACALLETEYTRIHQFNQEAHA